MILALLPIADGARWGEVVAGDRAADRRGDHADLGVVEGPVDRGAALARGRRGWRLCLVGIALMRDGVGPSAGYGPLIFLPVLWSALERRRRDLAFVLVGVALVYFTPLLLGLDRYPTTQWRGAILMVVVSGGIGYAVIELVEHVRNEAGRSAAILGAMGEGFALDARRRDRPGQPGAERDHGVPGERAARDGRAVRVLAAGVRRGQRGAAAQGRRRGRRVVRDRAGPARRDALPGRDLGARRPTSATARAAS